MGQALVEHTREHISNENEVSSDTFLEWTQEVLRLFGAQETAAEPSPLWPVWSHWL